MNQSSFTPVAISDADIYLKHCINLALPTLVPVLNSPAHTCHCEAHSHLHYKFEAYSHLSYHCEAQLC